MALLSQEQPEALDLRPKLQQDIARHCRAEFSLTTAS